jgi:hypothetical protein
MTQTHNNPRRLLDDIAASIRKLSQYLDNGELEGRPLTVNDIDAIARQLQFHVEQLLVAANTLRGEQCD